MAEAWEAWATKALAKPWPYGKKKKPKSKPKPKIRYYVQVATCIHKECVEDYQFLLKRFDIDRLI